MEYDKIFDQSLYIHRYRDVTERLGPSEQLLAFVSSGCGLDKSLALENFSDLSLEARSDIFSVSHNTENLERKALDLLLSEKDVTPDISSEEEDLSQLILAEYELDQVLKKIDTLGTYLDHRNRLLSTTSLSTDVAFEQFGVAIESLTESAHKGYEKLKVLTYSLMGKVDHLLSGVKALLDKILNKIKVLIEKIKEKALDLGRTIKAHPIKSALIAIGTIAAIAGAIYLYKEYAGGYNIAEKEHFELVRKHQRKIRESQQDYSALVRDTTETIKESDRLHEKLSKLEEGKKALIANKPKIDKAAFLEEKAKYAKSVEDVKKEMARQDFFYDKPFDKYSDMIDAQSDQSVKDAMREKLSFREAQLQAAEKEARIRRELQGQITRRTAKLTEVKDYASKMKDVNSDISALKENIAKVERNTEALKSMSKQNEEQFLSLRSETKNIVNSWDAKKRSLFSKFNQTFEGTFLASKNSDVKLLDGTIVPRASFEAAFPPQPQTKTMASLGVTANAMETAASSASKAFTKLGSAIADFSKSIPGYRMSSGVIACIKAVYHLLTGSLSKLISFISGIFTSYA